MNPGYFAVLPAEVRYDANIEPSAKLLYAEITALSNKTGECFASNAYFAGLYGVDDRTVRRWKSSLENAGYIETCKTNGHVFLIGQGRTKMSGGADKNVRGGGQKCPGSTYSVFNNKFNNYSYYGMDEQEEEKEQDKKIVNPKNENEKCYTVEEVEARIRVQNFLDEFWYKLGSLDDLRTNIAEMLNHYAEKGKTVPANLAESRLRSWLKPKFETEEDRDEMKKAKKRAQKRSEISKTIKDTENEKRNDGGIKEMVYDDIPEHLKRELFEKAKIEIESDRKFAILLSNPERKNGIIKAKALQLFKKLDTYAPSV